MSQSSQNKNKKTAFKVFGFVAAMFILAYASFPLYNLFCKVTGFGGTPKDAREVGLSEVVGSKQIKVLFNADVMKDVPWNFKPLQRRVSVTTGENKMVFYTAENTSSEPVKGVATFNVTPDKAAQYFSKVECFCFVEQTLEAGEKVEMPVSFYIDPAIEEDPKMSDVKTMTLSYTFFKSES